jgi:uncharacterized protein (DUF1499 family)
VIPGLPALYLYGVGGIVALVVGVTALVQLVRGRPIGLGRAVALPVAMIFLIGALGGIGVPAINDFTTSLADPPAFRHAASLPENAGRDMSYPAAFADQQRACCSDLRAARIAQPPAQTLEMAADVAQGIPGWEIGATDASAGQVEAVATSRVFGFRDDIVIRVQDQDGVSVVDMRSKSRDGRGDLGANANRIREFIAKLEAVAAEKGSRPSSAPPTN